MDIILSDSDCHVLQSRKSIASAESVLMATVDLDEQDRRVMSSSEASSSSEVCSIDEVSLMALSGWVCGGVLSFSHVRYKQESKPQ